MIRDNECFEPRVKNYINYFDRHSISYHVIAWNRNGKAELNEKISFFQHRAEYGKRLLNIPHKIAWIFFVIKQIFKYKNECDVIHACDIDAVLPALLAGKFFKKKIVFDIFDWISSLTGKGMVYRFVEWLQNYAYSHSDYVILCEEERMSQAKSYNPSVYVLPNIPDEKIEFDIDTSKRISEERKKYKYTISYVGVFDRDRGLENLLECVSKSENVLLNIAGFGVLNDLIQNYSNNYSNINYWGQVEYRVGQTIMKESDLIAAMYHLTSPLHKFAAPNKYYESLMLEVPLITTKNTLVGSKVLKYDTGFVIDESIGSLQNLISSADIGSMISTKKCNCRQVWDEVYSSYRNDFMKEKYLKIFLGKKG